MIRFAGPVPEPSLRMVPAWYVRTLWRPRPAAAMATSARPGTGACALTVRARVRRSHRRTWSGQSGLSGVLDTRSQTPSRTTSTPSSSRATVRSPRSRVVSTTAARSGCSATARASRAT